MKKPIIIVLLSSLAFSGCGKKEPKPVVNEPPASQPASVTPATAPPPAK